MKKIVILITMLAFIDCYSQNKGTYSAYQQLEPFENNIYIPNLPEKEWSKDVALFRSKQFLFQNVLGVSEDVKKFTVEPLAAAKSDELTTLIYKCDDLNKSGLILGFYGGYWNENGVNYNGYGFKHLDSVQAVNFLDKIQKTMDENKKFLQSDNDNNNVYFEFDDMQILMYRDGGFILRIFWNGFDSTWENTAFQRSKRRFERKI